MRLHHAIFAKCMCVQHKRFSITYPLGPSVMVHPEHHGAWHSMQQSLATLVRLAPRNTCVTLSPMRHCLVSRTVVPYPHTAGTVGASEVVVGTAEESADMPWSRSRSRDRRCEVILSTSCVPRTALTGVILSLFTVMSAAVVGRGSGVPNESTPTVRLLLSQKHVTCPSPPVLPLGRC